MINSERDHVEKLYVIFSDPKNQAFRDELEAYKADVKEYMCKLDISDSKQYDEYNKSQAKLELINIWLKLPEETQLYLKALTVVKRALRI